MTFNSSLLLQRHAICHDDTQFVTDDTQFVTVHLIKLFAEKARDED
ncbi:hypothetical protein [Coleofasciculus sp. FACHB-542]|nr:hypothetical protein [Coleofasciculus sp. FACHB-542]MBD2083775.1 hypothetical protein [Coleofasciculus sp. FACHB-542]